MKLTKYNKYKNTNIQWLGDIPEHWEVKRAKDISKVFVPQRDKPQLVETIETPWITSDLLKNSVLNLEKIKYYVETNEVIIKGIRTVPENSVLASCIGEFSLTAINLIPVVINQQIQAFTSFKKTNEYYFNYLIQSEKYKNYFNRISTATTLKYLNKEKFELTLTLIPPLSEQTAIANYLDQKTAQIDRKVDLLSQKIEKYKELKKSLINETVCRGLDKNVKLKPSGIDWIGDIPEHWEVKRLKDIGFLYSGLSGKSAKDFNQENNPYNKAFITFVNIANNQYIKNDNFGSVVILESDNQNRVKKNDLFFLMSSESYTDIGKTSLLLEDIEDTYLNSFCKGFRITNKLVKPLFINYLMSASSFRENLIVQGKGFTRINLKIEKINDFQFLIPPTTEQTAIAQYLDEKTSKIDQITANLSQQIETLKELRKSLINEVVTGKVRVID
jgi:type I restriction enzyme S subunit